MDRQATEDRDRLEAELVDAREALRESNEKVQYQASKFVSRKTAKAHEESRFIALRTTLESDQAAFARSAERAGYTPLEAFRLKDREVLEADLAEANERSTQARKRLDEIEQARQQLERAEEKLEAATAAGGGVDEQVRELDETARALRDRIATREADRKSLEEDLVTRTAALRDELAQFDVDEDEDASIEQLLEAAERRKTSFLDLRQQAEVADKAVAELDQRVANVAQRLEAAEKATSEAAAQVETRQKRVDELDAEIAECLGGADPDEAKEALDKAVREARKTHEAVSRELAETTRELSVSTARRKDLDDRNTAAKSELAEAEKELAGALERAGVERNEVALHLLTAEQRKRLQRELRELDEQKTRAHTRLEDATKRLEKHAEKALAAPEETLEEVRAEHATIHEQLNEATLELGALR
ncbi:MAG TPA: hypothetical protein VLD39_01265, partial [Gammaproteobacteria bacterium]|nr:hypothetical protein [Gammaproteobacteria bacterium]